MSLFDLIPWSRERGLTQHRPEGDPFWALHRELSRCAASEYRSDIRGQTP